MAFHKLNWPPVLPTIVISILLDYWHQHQSKKSAYYVMHLNFIYQILNLALLLFVRMAWEDL